MAEQSETPKILDELSKSNAAKASVSSIRKQQTARRRFIIVVVILLPIIAAVLFVGYLQISLQSELAQMDADNRQLRENLEAQAVLLRELQKNQSEASTPVEFDDSLVRELETAFDQDIDRLDAQLADLQSKQLMSSNVDDREWKIFEAEYLLGVAAQKLNLEGDIATAGAQLKRADQALVDSGSAKVFAVRQAIAGELQQLRNLKAVDREGIYLQLDKLQIQMQGIDLLNSMRTEFQNRRNTESQTLRLGADAGGYLDASLEFLSSIFVWRKWEETPQAMLAPGQDELIKQNLRLMLEQAQLALLMRDNALYQQALAKGRDWFQRYAVTDSEQGRTIALSLDQLSSYDINPILPALTQSLSLINQLTANER